MIHFTAIAPSPHLQSVVARYILNYGYMPENAPLKNVMVPGIMETISFNLNPQPQISFIANQKVEMKDGNVLGQYPRSFEVSLGGHVNIIGVHL